MAVYLVIFLRRSRWCGKHVHLDGDSVIAGPSSDFDETGFSYVYDAVGEVVEVVEFAYLIGFVVLFRWAMNQFSVFLRMLGWSDDGSWVEYTIPMLNLAPSLAILAQMLLLSSSLALGSRVCASSA